MRKLILLLMIGTGLSAQKNIVRINATGAIYSLAGLQYERKVGKRLSFNNTFFYRPKVTIPFGKGIDKLAKDYGVGLSGIKFQYIFMNEAKVATKGYSPELRFYTKKRKMFVGLFGQYEDYDIKVPASLPVRFKGQIVEVKTPVNFTFSSLTGGLLIGKSFLFKKLSLDIVIAGVHAGSATKFKASAQNELIPSLNDLEKTYLLEKLNERFGVSEKYFESKIDASGAVILSKRPVPIIGIRGLSLNIGYKF